MHKFLFYNKFIIVEEWKTNLMSLATFYFTSYVLNMFRTLIYPSSGACDCVVELPHRSSCSKFDVCWNFGAAGFRWCSFCRLKITIFLYMFWALCAHHEEVKILLHSIWYHHTCMRPPRAQVERGHRRCCRLVTSRQHRRCIIPQAVNTV